MSGKKKKVRFYIFIFAAGIVLLCMIVTIIKQQRLKNKYMVENCVGDINTILTQGNYEIQISNPALYEYEDYYDALLTKGYGSEDVEKLREYGRAEGYDIKIMQVHVKITKIKEDDSSYDLTDIILYQKAYYRTPDTDILYLMTGASPVIHLSDGESRDFDIVYDLYSDGFTEADWKRVGELDYEIVTAIYPKRLGVYFKLAEQM